MHNNLNQKNQPLGDLDMNLLQQFQSQPPKLALNQVLDTANSLKDLYSNDSQPHLVHNQSASLNMNYLLNTSPYMNNSNDSMNISLPLATQWIANLNSSLNNGMHGGTAMMPALNQSISDLLPAFLSNTNKMGHVSQPLSNGGLFSFPAIEIMGLNQQFQSNNFSNMQFQTQLIDNLKNNNVCVWFWINCIGILIQNL